MIALDVRRYADLMNDLGDLRFNVGGAWCRCGGGESGVQRVGACLQKAAQMLAKAAHVKGLHQKGIGTCGTINCTGTCLRSTTLDTYRSLSRQKGWMNTYGGENGRIYWNGKLLVNFYTLKAD